MARTARVCGRIGCPEIVIGGNYCTEHAPKKWDNPNRPKKPNGWARTRSTVLHRAGGRCTYCGQPATEVDHIVPVSRGGSDRMSNLTASCTSCNQSKNIAERTGQTWTPPNQRP